MLSTNKRKDIETPEYLDKYLYLDESLVLRWRVNKGKVGKANEVAGCLRTRLKDACYRNVIGIDGLTFAASRIVWILYNRTSIPIDKVVDHINNNECEMHRGLPVLSDLPSNLRLVICEQNQHNRKIGKNNTSGTKGIVWNKTSKRWVAQINKGGKIVYHKYFLHIEDAKSAIFAKRLELHGEYARCQ